MNINRIIISGNLVADPTLRETNSGTPVASATIANNEFFNDGDGERHQVTTFADVTVWVSPTRASLLWLRRVKRSSSKANCVVTIGNPTMARSIPSTSSKPKAGNSPNTAARKRAPRMLPPRTPKKARKPLQRKPSNHFTGTGGVTNTPGTKTSQPYS